MRYSFAALFAAAALCQSSAPKPAFEIADVHVSARETWVKTQANKMRSAIFNAGRYEIRRATMLDLIRIAYSVDEDQVFGGPPWLDYDRFEVIAKAPPATSPANRRLMLQSLLADRFHLVVRPDSKPIPAWLLSVVKGGSKLKRAEGSGSTGCQTLTSVPPDSGIRCRNVDLKTFLGALRGYTGGYFRDIVVDATGIEGFWDIDIQYPQPRIQWNGFLESMSKQLGLTLELKTAPQPVLSVESVAEQPTANPPGVAAALPPLPSPEFEVASIKPCDRTARSSAQSFLPGGRVALHCVGLMNLIERNWGFEPFQYPPGSPKWLTAWDGPQFDIEAKAPARSLVDAAGTEDPDALQSMMRALLVDRFKMAVHYEDRPMDAYTLVAVKPKLTKADPAGRTGCKREYRGDQGPEPSQRLVCRNITMAQFAEQIPVYDLGIFFSALDGTGIEGAWDFTLNYDMIIRNLPPIFAGRGSTEPGQAPEPSGGLSLADALTRQLGLKLEMHKRPVRVMVIDHIEQKPTEN